MNIKKLKITISYEDNAGNTIESSPVDWRGDADTIIDFNFAAERPFTPVYDHYDSLSHFEDTGFESFEIKATKQGPRRVLPKGAEMVGFTPEEEKLIGVEGTVMKMPKKEGGG
jgi:hypothetical protein